MAKKKAAKNKGKKKSSPKRKMRKVTRASARRRTGARKGASKASRKGAPKASRKGAPKASRKGALKASRKGALKASRKGAVGASRKGAVGASRKGATGGSGREETLAQTPEAGRTVRGLTNPMPTRRSTGTPAGAGSTRRAPALDRARRQLREIEETVEGPPSSLDMERGASAARSGRQKLQGTMGEHHETGPAMTGGDVDADWEDAYAVGDEAPGGDNPTPDQDIVDDIGRALGVQYQDNEELKGADKISERDKHRWELDPASSDDYKDRE
jgi:hypothetical protein